MHAMVTRQQGANMMSITAQCERDEDRPSCAYTQTVCNEILYVIALLSLLVFKIHIPETR
jgi:hypothetical protein